MNINGPHVIATHPRIVELERLGDEIAELSAHLDAATARLLDLIRDFDARGGWNTGFMSCAAWLSWRVGLGPRARHAAAAGRGACARRAVVLQGPGADARRDARDRRATAARRQGRHRRARRADRPPLAPDGSQGGSGGDDAAPPEPRPARVSQ